MPWLLRVLNVKRSWTRRRASKLIAYLLKKIGKSKKNNNISENSREIQVFLCNSSKRNQWVLSENFKRLIEVFAVCLQHTEKRWIDRHGQKREKKQRKRSVRVCLQSEKNLQLCVSVFVFLSQSIWESSNSPRCFLTRRWSWRRRCRFTVFDISRVRCWLYFFTEMKRWNKTKTFCGAKKKIGFFFLVSEKVNKSQKK